MHLGRSYLSPRLRGRARCLTASTAAAAAITLMPAGTLSAQSPETPAAWRVECTGDGKVLECRALQQIIKRDDRALECNFAEVLLADFIESGVCLRDRLLYRSLDRFGRYAQALRDDDRQLAEMVTGVGQRTMAVLGRDDRLAPGGLPREADQVHRDARQLRADGRPA